MISMPGIVKRHLMTVTHVEPPPTPAVFPFKSHRSLAHYSEDMAEVFPYDGAQEDLLTLTRCFPFGGMA